MWGIPPALQILGEICSNFFERTPPKRLTICDLILAETQNDTDLLAKIDVKLSKPATLPDNRWQEVLRALEIRKKQLSEELDKERRYRLNDDSTSLLSQLLNRGQEES